MDKYTNNQYHIQKKGEYEPKFAWETGIGLQAVDGLEVSDYLREAAEKQICGKIDYEKAVQMIDEYYNAAKGRKEIEKTKIADLVATRIAGILSEQTYSFYPGILNSIHKVLFDGIYDFAGKFRDYNILKNEWVLNGDTVRYGEYYQLKELVDYDIQKETDFSYSGLSDEATIKHIARFFANLWQIHPFGEGNTRTVSVFLIERLRYLGFDLNNNMFADNSWYLRNALVRASYINREKGIFETTEYLELFLENLLLEKNNKLSNREMHVDYKKEMKFKESVLNLYGIRSQTVEHIERLYKEYGDGKVFGRNDVIKLCGITQTPASRLLKTMLEAKIIGPISGQGKGRYVFK